MVAHLDPLDLVIPRFSRWFQGGGQGSVTRIDPVMELS